MAEYVAHLAASDSPITGTACGEPWQGWQAPEKLDLLDPYAVVIAPHQPPRPHQDQIRQCQACLRRARDLIDREYDARVEIEQGDVDG